MRAQSSARAACRRLIAALAPAAGVTAIEIVVAGDASLPPPSVLARESASTALSSCAAKTDGGAAAGSGRRDVSRSL
jgi:hypothetical protein